MWRATAGPVLRRSMTKSWPLGLRAIASRMAAPRCASSGDARKGAPIGVDFNTYAGVLEFSDRIGARSLWDTPTMPPGGGPDLEERARLEEWLQCEVAADRAALAEQR